jgi:CheY-like chemotaxis protein
MKKVLLTSEYKLFMKRNTNLLMMRGFRLFTETTGAEALKLHELHHFDLILSDFKLEDMSGCTLCSLIRIKDENVPIILTCHNLPGSIERVEQSGATAMLLKPLDPISLLETMGSYLGLQLGRSKRVVLRVRVFSRTSALEFYCYSHDISSTGILLETGYHLELANRIICQFTLPNSCEIETEGEIVRCMTALECENLYGVAFIGLPLSSRKAIDNYVASNTVQVARVGHFNNDDW